MVMKENDIKTLIEEAKRESQQTQNILGKEVYQKRFKPVYEGYITALCKVLEKDEDEIRDEVRTRKE